MIDSQQEGQFLVVKLNRPDRRNALSAEACARLSDALDSFGQARAVILTAVGSSFCAGGDFEELERFAAADADASSEALYGGFQRMIRTIRNLPVPVIAAVNGHAMGAGMDLALACDLRVVSKD